MKNNLFLLILYYVKYIAFLGKSNLHFPNKLTIAQGKWIIRAIFIKIENWRKL